MPRGAEHCPDMLTCKTCVEVMLTREQLELQTEYYRGTGGTSHDNHDSGFVPAFQDTASGEVFRSRQADGSPAAVHVLDGLPAHFVLKRDLDGHVLAVREGIVPGFIREDQFYTRAEAIQALAADTV